jgi:hypothetical protein
MGAVIWANTSADQFVLSRISREFFIDLLIGLFSQETGPLVRPGMTMDLIVILKSCVGDTRWSRGTAQAAQIRG